MPSIPSTPSFEDCAAHELRQSAAATDFEALGSYYQRERRNQEQHPLPDVQALAETCAATSCACPVDRMKPGEHRGEHGVTEPAGNLPGHCWRKCEGDRVQLRRSMTPPAIAATRVASCSVCQHPNADSIDAALADGTSQRSAAERFGVSRSAVNRHAAHLGG